MDRLKVLGGSSSAIILRRIMSTFLTEKLAAEMTLRGTKNKVSFSDYANVYKTALDAAHIIDANINIGVFENYLKNYFKNTATRK